MIEFIFSSGITDEQGAAVRKAYGHDGTYGWQQSAVEGYIIGTVIVTIAFVAKSFLDGFIKEAGKDTYAWLKAKLALKAAEQSKPIKAEYRVWVGDIYFIDANTDGVWETRHEKILPAVNQTLALMSPDLLSRIVEVELKYDEKTRRTSPRGCLNQMPVSWTKIQYLYFRSLTGRLTRVSSGRGAVRWLGASAPRSGVTCSGLGFGTRRHRAAETQGRWASQSTSFA